MPIGVSSAPYAKFPQPGVRHGGEIVAFRIVQTTEPKSRRPQYLQQDVDGKWEKTFSAYGPDGRPNDPITQWEITVDTGVEDENGDSELRVFVDPRKGRRGTTTAGKRGGDAVAVALKKAKAHRIGLEIGGKFFLTFDGKIDDGDNKVNTWSAEYEAPEGGPGTGKALDEVPWLVGGGRYDKQAELARWEAAKAAGTAASFVPPAAAAPNTQDRSGVWPANHDSSPRFNRPGAQEAVNDPWATTAPATSSAGTAAAYDDEPPF